MAAQAASRGTCSIRIASASARREPAGSRRACAHSRRRRPAPGPRRRRMPPGRGAPREDRDAFVAPLQLCDFRAQRIGGDERRRRDAARNARRAFPTRAGRSRRAASACARAHWRSPSMRDATRPQQHRLVAGKGDDRRFDADVAGAAVEDQVDVVAEIVGDVLRGRRRDVTEAIGRRRRNAVAKRGEQRACDRMRRHAQSDARPGRR